MDVGGVDNAKSFDIFDFEGMRLVLSRPRLVSLRDVGEKGSSCL